MGKLGGGELNFHSDIDLILLYPEDGETDGTRAIDNAEFFLRLGQKIVQLLATPTVEGFVYRVDLRLRPFGDSGRVALSFGAFEHYLQQHGRDWERYAYVKARALTAIEHYPALYDEVLRPFVYRRYLDFGVFEVAARHEGDDRARSRAARAAGQRQARPGRHSRDRVHRAGVSADPRRQRPASAEPRAAHRAAAARRAAIAAARSGRGAGCGVSISARASRIGCSSGTTNRRISCRKTRSARARLALAMGASEWDALSAELGYASTARRAALRADGVRSGGDADARLSGRSISRPAENARGCCAGHRDAARSLSARAAARQLPTTAGSTRPGGADCTSCSRRLLPLHRAVAGRRTRRSCAYPENPGAIGGRTVYLALLNENAAALRRLVAAVRAKPVPGRPDCRAAAAARRADRRAPDRGAADAARSSRKSWQCVAQRMQDEDPERQVEMLRAVPERRHVPGRGRRSDRPACR